MDLCDKIHLKPLKIKITMIVTRNTENMVFIYEEHTFVLGEKNSGNTKPARERGRDGEREQTQRMCGRANLINE